MRKKYFLIPIFVGILSYGLTTVQKGNSAIPQMLSTDDVEALANCESVDGHDNDGHCTKNDYKVYFCESPGFFDSKDCLQGK